MSASSAPAAPAAVGATDSAVEGGETVRARDSIDTTVGAAFAFAALQALADALPALAAGARIGHVGDGAGNGIAVIERDGLRVESRVNAFGGVSGFAEAIDPHPQSPQLCEQCLLAAAAAGSSTVVRG